jgi:hypothetical protein
VKICKEIQWAGVLALMSECVAPPHCRIAPAATPSKVGLDTACNTRYGSLMITAATYSFWYFSYPLPAEANARLI